MTVIDWIGSQRPAFESLLADEKRAVAEFSLIWPYFEATALKCNASYDEILRLAKQIEAAGRVDEVCLARTLGYFVNRYVSAGVFTVHHPQLSLGAKDGVLVNDVLLGNKSAPWERLAATLLIVYRFRNNLFHGPKWEYDLQGQQPNFETATAFLIAVLLMWGP